MSIISLFCFCFGLIQFDSGCIIPQRAISLIMAFFGVALAYMLRISLSYAITQMVLRPNTNTNGTVTVHPDVCPAFDDEKVSNANGTITIANVCRQIVNFRNYVSLRWFITIEITLPLSPHSMTQMDDSNGLKSYKDWFCPHSIGAISWLMSQAAYCRQRLVAKPQFQLVYLLPPFSRLSHRIVFS